MDETFSNSAYMTYLGIAALLGRIAGRARLSDGGPEECLDRAFADVNRIMASRDSGQCFKKTHDGGYAMFERDR